MSDTTENIEVMLVVVIGLLQVIIFGITVWRMMIYRNAIPSVNNLKRSVLFVPNSVLMQDDPKTILEEREKYQGHLHQGTKRVHILELENENSNKVIESMNCYLVRNTGAATDFDLIKDIVERHTSAVEEEINATVSVPLYLGLMGTVLGIIIGLFNMPSLEVTGSAETNDTLLNQGISLLVGGVKIAMIASFLGLFLTTLASAFIFKGVRSRVDFRKNELYTFIQVELLPTVNDGMAATMSNLQRNLSLFNERFSTNLDRLMKVFDANERSIVAQQELLDSLDKTKVGEMTRYNVKVLGELGKSVQHFETFNENLGDVSKWVGSTNAFLERTEDFQLIANDIKNTISQNQELLEFLSRHFQELDKHGNAVNSAVADVGHRLSHTFGELREHIQSSSDHVKQFTADESRMLKEALSQGKHSLSNLEHLSELKKDISLLRGEASKQNDAVVNVLKEVVKELRKDRNTNVKEAISPRRNIIVLGWSWLRSKFREING